MSKPRQETPVQAFDQPPDRQAAAETQTPQPGKKRIEYKEPQYPKLPLHGILHNLRGYIERRHREELLRQSVRWPGPPMVSLETVNRMRVLGVESCCNKSVPIYILPDNLNSGSASHWDRWLLSAALHNYLYRAWFRPYRNEIDCGQFLAQVFNIASTPPPPPTDTPAEIARFAASMSRAICAHVQAVQQRLGDRSHRTTPLDQLAPIQKEFGFRDWEAIHEQKFLLLQPLFRAVAIAFRRSEYSLAVPDIAQIPVFLVLTGVEDGLSAPITFESIADMTRSHYRIEDSIQVVETNLATAVNFVMDLEKREVAAFGPRPDPTETCKDPRRSCLLNDSDALSWAQKHGWEGDEAPEGPSSSWVDTAIYQEWTGEGAVYDIAGAQAWEAQCRKVVEEGPK